jgi:hypothetical protein
MKTTSLFGALCLALWLPLVALAAPTTLLTINDPEGDDIGDGSIVYPRAASFTPGDLDLRQLRVLADGDGLRFEATFRNPIRDPAGVKAGGLGSEDLSLFARRGFYAFNIDIYIDTDGVAGSGHTVTLPGRGARIDAAHAWEKVVVLTPRPELMRRQLHDALAESAAPAAGNVAAITDQNVFFATDVRVRGRTVSFFVPRSFLGSLGVADWSLTTIVTAAKTTIEAGLTLGKPAGSAIERLALGAQQPESGRPEYAVGYTGDRAPATAVVDLLGPDARQQRAQLAGGVLIGLNRGNQMGAAMPLPAETAAPAAATAAAAAPESGGSWFSRALQAVSRTFGGSSGATSTATTGAPAQSPPPAAVPPQSAAASAPRGAVIKALPPANAPPSASRPRDAAFFEEQELRLRALKRLRDGGLITEEEYQQKRREVLERL